MAGNKIKAIDVPLRDRTYIIGYAELMGYVGCKTPESLHAKFISKGLHPISTEGINYWKKEVVDKWIEDHNEYQEPKVRHSNNKKIAS
ncbi:MAG: hypothetical protein IKO26_07905 [Paludibacteraceae bacterium]|nr:hypothetical protein [Paludibacteraceae bacterium]